MLTLTESDVARHVEDVSAKLAEPRGRLGIQLGSAYAPLVDDEWPRSARIPALTLESPAYLNGRMVACVIGGLIVGSALGAAALFAVLSAFGMR